MPIRPRTAGAVLAAAAWINASEFLRNEVLVAEQWPAHFKALGLVFPAAPVNGMVWGLWGLLFAGAIYAVSRRFSILQTTAVAWTFGFVLMWLVCGNLGVLPFGILPYAVPLSLLEAWLAAVICVKVDAPEAAKVGSAPI